MAAENVISKDCIDYAIKALEDVDERCISIYLHSGRVNITDAQKTWEETAWHKQINDKIRELKDLL